MSKNKKIGKYSKEAHTKYQTDYIIKLIENRKLREAKRIINEEIQIAPKDKFLKSLLLSCYLLEKNYEEVLDYDIEIEEPNVINIAIAAIKLNDEEKLKYLYEKYFCKYVKKEVYDNREESYRMLKYYLTKKFDPTVDLSELEMTYREKMVWDYNKDHAVRYIISNYCSYNGNKNTVYTPNIDVKELFEIVQDSIEQNKGNASLTKIGDKYIFHLPGCGFTKVDNLECDYLAVSTIFNSDKILNMCPTLKPQKGFYTSISELYIPKHELEKNKVMTRVREDKKVNI